MNSKGDQLRPVEVVQIASRCKGAYFVQISKLVERGNRRDMFVHCFSAYTINANFAANCSQSQTENDIVFMFHTISLFFQGGYP